MSQYDEITKEIILKMIETGNIRVMAVPGDMEQENINYVNSVCQAYRTVYKAVINPKA